MGCPPTNYFSLLFYCIDLYLIENISKNCHGNWPKSQNTVQEHRGRDIKVLFEGFLKDKFHNVKTTDLTLLQCGAA